MIVSCISAKVGSLRALNKDKPLGPNRSRGFVLSAYFFCVNMFTVEIDEN